MQFYRILSFITVSLMLQAPAWAWNDTGHKLVAAIAYRGLTTEEQTAVEEILRSHANYNAWLRDFGASRTIVPVGQFIFMQASTWPDEIRDNHDPKTHPEWHYVDYPLRPPGYSARPAPSPKDDVVFAIGKCMDELDDAHLGKRRQAEYLSWLIHVVGDIHQPLHCSSLFNNTFHGKEGDRGGNGFYVKLKPDSANPVKLHTLWDGLAGNGRDPDNLAKKAAEFATTHSRASFGPAAFTMAPDGWSKESRALAVGKVYKLLPSLDGTKTRPVVLPPDYFRASRELAERQLTLAGYRLADQIRALLTARAPTP